MPVVIALLRAVNLAGHNKIKMDALRELCESLGLADPRTHLQSGNVVFRTREQDLVRLAQRLEKAIERRCGFRTDVILRTTSEVRAAIERNPFATRQGIDPSRLLVNFLAADPGPDARAKMLNLESQPEELHLAGRELYIYYTNGIGRSKLTAAVIERALKTPGTGRNWNTVRNLLEIAESLEAG
ncbi:MAG TPA: DUF1697 domain-containing protein [Terriglobia bacterium]|nr:DUF1697 domain-containing protein [Terriglobia bacterium]